MSHGDKAPSTESFLEEKLPFGTGRPRGGPSHCWCGRDRVLPSAPSALQRARLGNARTLVPRRLDRCAGAAGGGTAAGLPGEAAV